MAEAKHLQLLPGFSVGNSPISVTNFSLDGPTDQAEWVFQADEAMTITRLGFRYGARTLTPPTYTISLQGVDGSGNPDGTIKGGGSPASKSFTPPADTTWDATWRWLTLDNSYTCTRGEFLSIVITNAAADASNFSSVTTTASIGYSLTTTSTPYAIANNAGVRTRSSSTACFAYSSATAVYGMPLKAVFAPAVITQSTTPDEYATMFAVPANLGASYQVAGIMIRALLPAAKTMKVQLYSGTTVLQTITYDTDITVAGSERTHLFMFTETTLVDLQFGQPYRIGFQPQDAAGNYTFYGYTQDSNAEWGAYPLGIDWSSSSRTDAGAWTDDTATRLICMLLLKEIKKPAPGIIMAPG